MTTLLKIFLPIYFLLFFGLAMFWRSYIAWKRTGVNPYKLGNGDTVHDYVGKLFRVTLIGWLGCWLLKSKWATRGASASMTRPNHRLFSTDCSAFRATRFFLA